MQFTSLREQKDKADRVKEKWRDEACHEGELERGREGQFGCKVGDMEM